MNEQLKPCPFCGRKMKFYRKKYTNKYGKEITEQYFMHEEEKEGEDSCILDDICMPFVIGAGDANLETGYMGEYAEKWNKRVEE